MTGISNTPAPPADTGRDEERLARAGLALVCDGADHLMNAILRSAPATEVWKELHDPTPRTVRHLLAMAGHGLGDDDAIGDTIGGVYDNTVAQNAAAHPTVFQNTAARPAPARGGAHGAIARSGRLPKGAAAMAQHIRGWQDRAATQPESPLDLAETLTDGGALRILIPGDEHWPVRVEDLGNSDEFPDPLCLWVRGDPAALTACDAPLGIVGSREATGYGTRATREAARAAAERGHVIVSGGAMGIDAVAHAQTVAAGGRTVAVMAGGLDHVGPVCNLELFHSIVDSGGALISEVAPQTVPVAWRFLTRNRLIAALSHTVLVTQARYRSGALNTATHALRLNRIVAAIPGDVDRPSNAGCNELIYRGKAILLPAPESIVDLLPDEHRHGAAPAIAQEGGENALFPDSALDAAGAGGSVAPSGGAHASMAGPARARRPEDGPETFDLDDAIVSAIRRLRRTGGSADIASIHQALESGPYPGLAVRRTAIRLGALELAGRLLRNADGTFAVPR